MQVQLIILAEMHCMCKQLYNYLVVSLNIMLVTQKNIAELNICQK